jgi:hypothetical protein
MEFLTDMVTTIPEGTSPAKVDELRAAEAVRAAEPPKQANSFDCGVRLLVLANGAALDCSVPPMRQSFVKPSPRYPFMSG